MIKKIIASLLTGLLIMLSIVLLFGFIIETSYTFIYMNSFWFNIEPKTIITILILIALVLSCLVFACIADKD